MSEAEQSKKDGEFFAGHVWPNPPQLEIDMFTDFEPAYGADEEEI